MTDHESLPAAVAPVASPAMRGADRDRGLADAERVAAEAPLPAIPASQRFGPARRLPG